MRVVFNHMVELTFKQIAYLNLLIQFYNVLKQLT